MLKVVPSYFVTSRSAPNAFWLLYFDTTIFSVKGNRLHAPDSKMLKTKIDRSASYDELNPLGATTNAIRLSLFKKGVIGEFSIC